jgi:hypothetical protein
MKLSLFYEQTKEIQIKAAARAEEHDRLAMWFRDLAGNVQQQRNVVDEDPSLAEEAEGFISRFERLLEEGPPDGSPLGGDAAEQKPEPQRRRKRTRAQIAHDTAAVESGRPDLVGRYDVIPNASDDNPVCPRCLGVAPGTPSTAKASVPTCSTLCGPCQQAVDDAREQSLSNPEPLNDMNTRAPRRTDAEKAAKAAEFGAEIKVADQERVHLAGLIRKLHAINQGLIPSDAAHALGVSIQAVRDAWPLLTGEKAP